MIRSENFAQQLCCLFNVAPIAKKNQHQNHCAWLMMTLSENRIKENLSFPTISKKIRDEAIEIEPRHWDNANGPHHFQRSDYYMTMKVLLQLTLTQGKISIN